MASLTLVKLIQEIKICQIVVQFFMQEDKVSIILHFNLPRPNIISKKTFSISVIYKALRQYKTNILSSRHSFVPSFMTCIWLYQCVHTRFVYEAPGDMYSCLLCFKFNRLSVSLVHNEYRVVCRVLLHFASTALCMPLSKVEMFFLFGQPNCQ